MTSTDTMLLFDTGARARNRARAEAMGPDGDFLRREIAARLDDRLADINRQFGAVLDLGGAWQSFAAHRSGVTVRNTIDDDSLGLEDAGLDLVVSNLSLHWVNDLPGLLYQANRALKADGLFMASLFGGETLKELRHALLSAEAELTGGANARVIPFVDVRDAGGLLQRAGFALPVADLDTITVTYEHPLKLMQDLRAMGETNALRSRSRKPLRRDVLLRACELYMEAHAGPDGRIPATFQIVYMTGWHPHESQQKPLKPGSGKVNLADALKAGKPPTKD